MAKAGTEKPKAKAKAEPRPKLTDKERHKRFVAMAQEVEAADSAESFDAAFKRVVKPPAIRKGD